MSPQAPRFHVTHIGFEMAFHHALGADLNPAPNVIEAYEADKEHAEIFIQNSSGTAFSQAEMLNWFLLQTRTTLAEHLPPKALDATAEPVLLTVPIRFKPGTFHMQTEAGAQDLSHLKLMCKVRAQHGEG